MKGPFLIKVKKFNLNTDATIKVAQPKLIGNESKYVLDCLESGWISSVGEYVERFESSFAEFVGTRFAASCSNGTAALHLALMAIGVGPGDEVIVPTLTYIAAANAVRYCGATPIFVDSENDTMNLDPSEVKLAITPKTKAVIAVHLYGHPADIHELRLICDPLGIKIVEDAAEAHGSSIGNAIVGSLGDVATFSFYGNKIITTGEGGMITTNSPEINQKVRLLKGQGQDPDRRYWFLTTGYNYRLTNIAAAIGLAQLENIETHLDDRRRVASEYERCLESVSELIQLPITRQGYVNVKWLFTVVLGPNVSIKRDVLIDELAKRGIDTRPVFYPMHHLPPYFDASLKLPIAERLSCNGISLPTHGDLTQSDVEFVSKIFTELVVNSK